MNKTFCLLFLFCALCLSSFSQENFSNLTFKRSKTADAGNTLFWGAILVISPTLILEDGKGYFALSKELSAGKFPYGRAEFDYSYVFRSERPSLVHLSYNFDIPMNADFKDPSLFMISPGGGYYSDFTRKGFFAQIAIGLFASTGFSDAISIHPNLKFRNVFMSDGNPGVFEVSLGVGFGLYTR